jgi:predicted transcriptional regulator
MKTRTQDEFSTAVEELIAMGLIETVVVNGETVMRLTPEGEQVAEQIKRKPQ